MRGTPQAVAPFRRPAAVTPSATIEHLARRIGGNAEIRRYPAGHFDVYVEPWRTPNIDDQVTFLRQHLTPTTADPAETP